MVNAGETVLGRQAVGVAGRFHAVGGTPLFHPVTELIHMLAIIAVHHNLFEQVSPGYKATFARTQHGGELEWWRGRCCIGPIGMAYHVRDHCSKPSALNRHSVLQNGTAVNVEGTHCLSI